MKYILNTILETEEFGIRLGGFLRRGDMLCLNGDLGAGKTTLSKAIGQGLGVKDYITSPTFAIMNQYQGRLPMYHFDVYRLDGWEQLEDIGAEEYFYGDGVCLVEWAEKIEEYLPKDRLEIKLSMMDTENTRELVLSAWGKRYEDLLEELKK
jgi:tRNA threonylcarbamoyladenosine biosynthesis protein TsaE